MASTVFALSQKLSSVVGDMCVRGLPCDDRQENRTWIGLAPKATFRYISYIQANEAVMYIRIFKRLLLQYSDSMSLLVLLRIQAFRSKSFCHFSSL